MRRTSQAQAKDAAAEIGLTMAVAIPMLTFVIAWHLKNTMQLYEARVPFRHRLFVHATAVVMQLGFGFVLAAAFGALRNDGVPLVNPLWFFLFASPAAVGAAVDGFVSCRRSRRSIVGMISDDDGHDDDGDDNDSVGGVGMSPLDRRRRVADLDAALAAADDIVEVAL